MEWVTLVATLLGISIDVAQQIVSSKAFVHNTSLKALINKATKIASQKGIDLSKLTDAQSWVKQQIMSNSDLGYTRTALKNLYNDISEKRTQAEDTVAKASRFVDKATAQEYLNNTATVLNANKLKKSTEEIINSPDNIIAQYETGNDSSNNTIQSGGK